MRHVRLSGPNGVEAATVEGGLVHAELSGRIEPLDAGRLTLPEPYRLPVTTVSPSPPLGLDLASGEIQTIIWATGFRPDYSWLDVPVLDRKGRIRHDGGVVASPSDAGRPDAASIGCDASASSTGAYSP